MRFSAPSALSTRRVGLSLLRASRVSTPNAIPPQPFSDSRGVDPQRALQPCFMPLTLLGFRPFRVFPSGRLLPGSSPGDSLSAFLRPLRFRLTEVTRALATGRAPRAFVLPESVLASEVLHSDSSRYPPGLFRLYGFLRLILERLLPRSSAPVLSRRSFSLDLTPGLQRFPNQSPASPALAGAGHCGVLGLRVR
jgi:hypothetical protein